MTALYRPVLIETAEQAEALPEGTVVTAEDKDGPWEKYPDGKFKGAGRLVVDTYRVLDRIALVPIEAEEEWAAQDAHGGRTLPSAGHPDPRTQIAAHVDTLAGLGVRDVPVRRFVTEWTEEA